MELEDYSYDEGAAFSMDFSTLGRINYWLWMANKSQAANDIDSWLHSLKVLWKEADAYMKDKERDEYKFQQKYNAILKKYQEFLDYQRGWNSQQRKASYAPPRAIFDSLFEWELELRRVFDKKGFLMRKGDDARTAML